MNAEPGPNSPVAAAPHRRLPAEGEGGVFTQSWFPICRGDEVQVSSVKGSEFLDGRIVVFRNAAGVAQVLSAYCPHVGADLAVGSVVNDEIRCAFHHWQMNHQGRCTRTGRGDPVPSAARLFRFPTVERFGLIWAFNGEAPSWSLPDTPFEPEITQLTRVRFDGDYSCDPWVIVANTPDWHHIQTVHEVEFDSSDMASRVLWTNHSMSFDLEGVLNKGAGPTIRITAGICGTSFFHNHVRNADGSSFYAVAGFGIPKPGHCRNWFSVTTPVIGSGSEAMRRATAICDAGLDWVALIASQDRPILNSIRYTAGALTRSDLVLGRYLEYLRSYPRAHPSMDFIR